MWGPLSEWYGRSRPLFIAIVMFVVAQIPVAVGRDAATVLAFRFLAGTFGSAAFAIPPAMGVDFLLPHQRSNAQTFYMTSVFVAPGVGPIVGSFLTVHYGWRGPGWFSLILSAITTIFALTVIRESSEAELRQRKIQRVRRQNPAVATMVPETTPSLRLAATKYLIKPIMMILSEPIVSHTQLQRDIAILTGNPAFHHYHLQLIGVRRPLSHLLRVPVCFRKGAPLVPPNGVLAIPRDLVRNSSGRLRNDVS